MITQDLLTTSSGDATATRAQLAASPEWPWGYQLVGDPLLRADDKFVRAYGRLMASLRDPRTRREIRARAEAKERALRRQLADLRRRNLPALAHEAAQELADQLAFLSLLGDEATADGV